MLRTSVRAGACAFALVAVLQGSAAVAAQPDDPAWPCVQRRVPSLSIGQLWSGPLPAGDWRDSPEIRELAEALAPRRTSLESVEAQVDAFVAGLPAEDRAEQLAQLFAGVLALIDAERGQIIEGIGRYARNQATRSDRVEMLQNQIATLTAAPDQDLDRIEELQDTLAWETRIFRDRAQALTFVCETPVLLEQRAFAIARLLAARI